MTQSSVTAQLDAIYLSISISYTFRFLKDLCILCHMAQKEIKTYQSNLVKIVMEVEYLRIVLQ